MSALALAGFAARASAATPLVQLDATTYQTEHCLFVIDSTVTWGTPATAYNDLYAFPFPRLSGYFDTLVAKFPGTYFSICYMANTGANNVPNYITRQFKATGIATPGTAGAPQSFATMDFCRYNLGSGTVLPSALAVYDHELGHAWAARVLAPSLANGHWLPNSTVDCQMGAGASHDGGVTVDKIYGNPAAGFRWHRVDNLRDNDYATFAEQTLYLMGAREAWPTAYVLNNPIYNADGSMTSSSVSTKDQAALIASEGGLRNPDYLTAQKRFQIGFVYIARDAAEVNTVYQNVEKSAKQFTTADALDLVSYRFQVPFVCDTKFRGSADGLLADLDSNATPTLSVTTPYVTSTDGTATIPFVAADADGPTPTVTVVPACTSATIVGSNVQLTALPDGVFFFTLKATDAGGKVTFAHFTVEVHRPAVAIAISAPPLDRNAIAGGVVNFTVAATGTPSALAYQWYRKPARTSTWNTLADGGAFSGATTATLAVTTGTTMDGDEFECLVSNAAGAITSASAPLVVDETAPAITTQPPDVLVAVGNVGHFDLVVAGAPATFGYFSFQWQKQIAGSGVWNNLADSAGVFIGTTTANLIVYGTIVAMTGDQYRCLITNTAGTATSNAATLTVLQLPAITTQPVGASAGASGTASFSVVANGGGTLTYQWKKGATPIAGATGTTLTLTNVTNADAAFYGVIISNAAGSTQSNFVQLTYTGPIIAPNITTPPQPQTATIGSPATFAVVASGTGPLTYQWFKNFQSISGATLATLSIASAQLSDAASYLVQVHNSAGTAQSTSATLTVLTPQTITFAALPNVGYTTTPLTLSATASSGLAVSFSVLSGPANVSGNQLTLTGAGVVTVRASQAGNATYAAAPNVDVAFTVAANFALWQQNNFSASDLANPAKSGSNAIYGVDGYPNLVKYALGLSPTLDALSGLPQIGAAGGNWTCTFTKPTSVTDATGTIEASTDLASWTTSGVAQSLVSSTGGTDTWQAAYSLASAQNIFFRLRVDAGGLTSYSSVLGGMTVSVAAGALQSFSLPLLHSSAGAGLLLGRIDAVGANYLDVFSAAWTAGAFTTAANPYCVRLLTGAAAGRSFVVGATANTATRLFVNNDGTPLDQLGIAPGDAFELILADTLASLFGSGTLLGDVAATTADNLYIWSGATWLTFYYNTTRARWERDTDLAASPTRDNFVLRPDRGFLLNRRAATPLAFYVFGRVPEIAPTLFHARPGYTLLTTGLPVGTTLVALGVHNSPGWQTGSLANALTTADLVHVWTGATWLTFFFDASAGLWRRNTDLAGSPSRNGFSLPAGRPVMLRRLTPAGVATDSQFSVPLNYSIIK